MMDIKNFWKSELKKFGFKQGKEGRMVKDYGDTVGGAHMFQSRFENRFFIDAGVIVKEVPTGPLNTHFGIRFDKYLAPGDLQIDNALNLENSMSEHVRELVLARTAHYLANMIDTRWSHKDWLFRKAEEPYDPNLTIKQSLVRHVAELDKNEES